MNYQLAIDTATDTCSVSLRFGDETRTEESTGKGIHSEQLFLQIKKLLSGAGISPGNLDAILVSAGPGSYTGLRISASAIKGLLFGMDIPVFACNTMAGFAANIEGKSIVHSIIDARRQHVYHQVFSVSKDSIQADTEVEIVTLRSLDGLIRPGEIISGTGYERLSDSVKNKATLQKNPVSAKALFHLYDVWKSGNCTANLISETSVTDFEPDYHSNSQIYGNA